MRRADKHLLCNVFVTVDGAFFTSASTILESKFVRNHALDISHLRKGNDVFIFGDEVLDVNVAADSSNFCTAVVGILVADVECLGLNNIKDKLVFCENFLIFLDFFDQFGEFFFDFFSFESGQLTESHLHDSGRLNVTQIKAVNERFLTLGNRL